MSKKRITADFTNALTGSFETEVTLYSQTKHEWGFTTMAKIDTGADRSSIDLRLANALRLHQIGEITVRNAMGKQKRRTVLLSLKVFGSKKIVEVTVANRRKMTTPFIIGMDLVMEDEDSE